MLPHVKSTSEIAAKPAPLPCVRINRGDAAFTTGSPKRLPVAGALHLWAFAYSFSTRSETPLRAILSKLME